MVVTGQRPLSPPPPSPAPRRAPTPAGTGRYMPALDGLRAFAVGAVIAYHLNLTRAGGGYLGVDVFFVLSGFLITGLLVGERARTGRVAFKAFWARRARRLLPALLLMLAALALYAGLGGPGLDRSSLRPDSLATLFYSANWHLIFGHQSYFAQFQAPSPLKHTWSLAIEEQFYLLWPLILVGLLRVARGSRRALVGAVLVMAVASAVVMGLLYHPGTDPSRIYYGTDTRAFELLVGAALAVVVAGRSKPSRGGRRLLHGAGLVAMALLIYACTSAAGPPGWMWRGGLFGVGLLTAVIIASVSQARSGPLGALFCLPPLRAIGVISYGLYLWHWPVIVLMTDTTTGLSGWSLKLSQVATMLVLATASYLLVERPIRQARLAGWGWLAAPAGVAATAGGLLVATVVPTTVAAAAPPPAPTAPATMAASGAAGPTGSDNSVLVVGDATASSLALGMAAQQGQHGLAVHDGAAGGCTVVDGFSADNTFGPVHQGRPSPGCQWRSKWPQQLQQWKPKVALMLFGADDTADHLVGGHWLRVGTPQWNAYYQDRLGQMVALLGSGGARVVMATVPQYRSTTSIEQTGPTFDQLARVDDLNAAYRSFAAAHPEVSLADLASEITPQDLRDQAQLTDPAAKRLGDGIDAQLSLIAHPTILLPPGRVLSPADPLRVMIVGDSLMSDASPGVTAALQATGVVKVVSDISLGGWGLTTSAGRGTDWQRLISENRPEVVLAMWSWDNRAAQADPAGYAGLVDQALGQVLAPGDGVDGVAILQLPRTGPRISEVDPARRAADAANAETSREAWNSLMESLALRWPGRYMFLSVAGSLEVNGQYSTWLPGPNGTWSRARKVDNAHFCPTGAGVLGQAVLQQLTPTLNLPAAAPGWWAGRWTRDSRYNDPPGACPNDQP